ncbi:MAG: hypothetical protein J7M17_06785 [Anaerolineae bacterium]|nr:hypothetical protein [Anaerolineae bacterium]
METTQKRLSVRRILQHIQRLPPARKLVLFLLLAGWGLMFLTHVLAWRQFQSPFPGFTVEPSGVLTPFGRSDWARFQVEPPLAEPERLVSVDGAPVSGNRALTNLLRRTYAPGGEAFFTFEHPDGSARTLLLPLINWRFRDFADIFLVPYLVSLVVMGLGTWVFWTRDDATGYLFTCFSLALGLTLSLIFDLTGSGVLSYLWIAALTLTGATLFHLGLLFPGPVRWLRRRPALQYLPYAPGLLLLVAGEATHTTWPSPWAFIPVWRLIYAFVGLSGLFFLAMQVYRLRRSPSATVQQQSRIILMGATLAFSPTLFWFMSNVVGAPFAFGGLYAAFIVLFPLAAAHAILHYRLAHTDALLARGVTYWLLTLLVIAALFELTNLLAQNFGDVLSLDDPFALSLLVLALVLIFNPLLAFLQRLTDRLFLRPQAEQGAEPQSPDGS